MTHLKIEQNNGVIEEVSSNVIKKLYDIVHSGNLDNTSNLIGRLHTSATYQDYIDYLEDAFKVGDVKQLIIDAAKKYIMFADPIVQSKLSTNWGDGTGVTLEDTRSIQIIPWNLFSGSAITSFDELGLFNTITELQWGAFNNCSKLTSIDLSNITKVGNNSLKGIRVPIINAPKLKTIDNVGGIFRDNPSCTQVNIGTDVPDIDKFTMLGEYIFSDDTSLVSVTGLKMVNSIGQWAFSNCTNLLNLDFTSNLTTLGQAAFYRCSNLKCIDLTNVTSINTAMFNGCSELIDLSTNDTTQASSSAVTYTFNWDTLYDSAFESCKLTNKSFNFPNVTNIGSYCFQYSGIKGITAPLVETIGYAAFNESSLSGVINLPSVTQIDGFTFQQTGVTEVHIPLCTSTNGRGACFSKCSNLQTVTIGSLTTIGSQTFFNCKNLKTINFNGITPQYNQASDYFELTLNNVTSIGSIAFQYTPLLFKEITYNNVTAPLHLILPNCTEIGWAAFNGCGISAISLLSNIPNENSDIFRTCLNLKYADISGLTKIYANMFCDCSNLKTVVLSSQVTEIMGSAFSNCSSLIGPFTLPATLTKLDSSVFVGSRISCLIFEGSTPPSTLGSWGWPNIPVYVPNDAVQAYQTAFAAATNEPIKNNIHPISDYNPS